MNKKGFFFQILFLFVITLVVVVGIGLQNSPDFQFEDLNWSNYNQQYQVQEGSDLMTSVTNIVFKFVDSLGYMVFELANTSVQIAENNQDWLNFNYLAIVLILGLLAPILIFVFKFSVILIVLIRDIVSARKEKRELKKIINNVKNNRGAESS